MKTVKLFGHTFDVPSDFTGWWCVRCDLRAKLPDDLDAPGKCPRCHKFTCYWVPAGEPSLSEPSPFTLQSSTWKPHHRQPARHKLDAEFATHYERAFVSAKTSHALFHDMLAAVDEAVENHGTPQPDTLSHRHT